VKPLKAILPSTEKQQP